MSNPAFIANALQRTLGVSDPKDILGRPFVFTYKDQGDRDVGFGGLITSFDISERGDVDLFVTTPKTGIDSLVCLSFNVRDPRSRGWYARGRPFGSGKFETSDIYGQILLI